MKRKILYFMIIFFFLLAPIVSADFNLEVEKIDKGAVIISELNNPAVYELKIINKDRDDMAEIYSLVGVSMAPKGTFLIPGGESKLEVRAYPGEEFRKIDGLYTFEYQIKGQNYGIFKDKLSFRVVSLSEVLSIGDINIHPDNSNVEIPVRNNVNTYLEDVELHFSSLFFDSVKKISLKPFEETKVLVDIDKNKIIRLSAGNYPMKVRLNIEDKKVEFKANIKYLEKQGTSVTKKSSGFIIRETSISKTNEGNIPATVDIEMSKDIISRLFTTFSIEPVRVERNGFIVNYFWQRDIGPQESFSVNSSTNYTFPFIVVILIVVIGLLVRAYTRTSLIVNKRVSFVKTKGGEFALRVILSVKARKHTDNIQVIDRLPMMAKLYERFGKHPDRIDEATRRLFWNIPRLNKGEERIFSYIIYSKVQAVGRFELPPALVIFEKDGEQREVLSNKAYFVSEMSED